MSNIPHNIEDTPVIKDIYSADRPKAGRSECKKLIEAFNNNSHIKKAMLRIGYRYELYKNPQGQYDGVMAAARSLNFSHEAIKKKALAKEVYNNYYFSYERIDNSNAQANTLVKK